jgi:hypothetical protein
MMPTEMSYVHRMVGLLEEAMVGVRISSQKGLMKYLSGRTRELANTVFKP